jgi:hypothetical protein
VVFPKTRFVAITHDKPAPTNQVVKSHKKPGLLSRD